MKKQITLYVFLKKEVNEICEKVTLEFHTFYRSFENIFNLIFSPIFTGNGRNSH